VSELVEEIEVGNLIVFQFRDWSQDFYMAVVLEIAFDPFLVYGRQVYYIYLSNGDNLFITRDEIIIKEII
tara:strand:+ start:606 stop:815 length:210 start_codon:yes stop_codon:yes gene_type:complete